MLINANSFNIPLADCSVQCAITSPPYYGLRNYRVDGQIGLEKTPEEYVEDIVKIFREVWRVLRDDGTVWIVIGDSYAGSGGPGTWVDNIQTDLFKDKYIKYKNPNRKVNGLKPKDLIMIPAMVGIALRNDGWYLRQELIWFKPNIMPESVKDRCTRAHEYILFLSKSRRYYYDNYAILEPANYDGRKKTTLDKSKKYADQTISRNGGERWPQKIRGYKTKENGEHESYHGRNVNSSSKYINMNYGGGGEGFINHSGYFGDNGEERFYRDDDGVPARNKRSVWVVSTVPYKGAHFATFPPKLIEPCILAGTSAKGRCPKCGAPWERIIKKEKPPAELYTNSSGPNDGFVDNGRMINNQLRGFGQKVQDWVNEHPPISMGWKPTCKCGIEETKPCIVLDPFSGTGTTGMVAAMYGRDYVGIELNNEYNKLAVERIAGTQIINNDILESSK